ncbi:hypothetical protein [Lewinella sp. W8]|uniref:hypothetical protein n=1 Tax=Lewinella sp. W8 TaxID=2528208 RepID=UPI001068C7F7|nr:hypothetical protein [Lewinella sp. W8]MTB50042.1 hypothetical protein [Lewinella sp. W8]
MELEQFRDRWKQLEDHPPSLDPEKIQRMVTRRYRRELRSLLWPELFFALLYLYFAALIVAFFGQLGNDFHYLLGGAMVVILIGIPVLRFILIRRLFLLGNRAQLLNGRLQDFARYRGRLLWLRRAQAGIGTIVFVSVAMLTARIYGEPEAFASKTSQFLLLGVAMILAVSYNHFILRRYQRRTDTARSLLRELEDPFV